MTTELFYLLLTAILASSLWLPYIIGVNTTRFDGQEESFVRPPDHRNMQPWIHRAFRAHQNLLEQFLPFAVIVLIAQSLNVSNTITQWSAMLFFVLRILHAAGMITGFARFPLRPVVFTAGWILSLACALQILLYAAPKP